jgi:hypothetical protein
MSRVVLFFGIVLLLVGTAGVIIGMVGIPLQFTSTIFQAVTPTAAELCNPGETLDEVRGAEEYTALEGTRRAIRYFCVNDAGERREVTTSFVTGMLGDALRGLGVFAIPFLSSCICTVGLLFTAFGAIFSRRRAMLAVNNFAFPEDFDTTTASRQPSAASAALTNRLRQLEDARRSGLISEDEYQRMRQEALDNLT